MAYPTVLNRRETPNAASTTISVPFYDSAVAGDLVIAFIALSDTAQAITPTESFTNLSNVTATFHVIAKVLDGTEGTSTTVTVGTSTKSCVIAYTIQKETFSKVSVNPYLSSVASGSSTTPDPPTLSPGPGSMEYLWIAAFRQNGEEADDDTWCTAAPTSPGTFTNLTQTTTGTGGATATNGSLASAEYTATTATVDPGTFTVAQNLAWRAYTLAVHAKMTGSFTANAVIKASSGTKTFTADATVKASSGTKTFTANAAIALHVEKTGPTADAIIKKPWSITGPTADAVIKRTFALSFTADAVIKKPTSITGPTANAVIKRTYADGAFTANAVVKAPVTGLSFTADATIKSISTVQITADANVFGTVGGSFTAQATLGAGVSYAPVWVSPANDTPMSVAPVLVFEIPAMAKSMHFHIQLDKVDTFDGPDLRNVKSNNDQTGWEYWNDSAWTPIPTTGVPSSYGGNEARYTVQTPLSTGTWYRRVRAG